MRDGDLETRTPEITSTVGTDHKGLDRPRTVCASYALNRGAVFFDASQAPPTPQPGFAGARCSGDFLRVEMQGAPPRDFMSRLLDHAIGDGNYHPIEYGLFFVNLRDNARERIAAFTKGAAPVPGDSR